MRNAIAAVLAGAMLITSVVVALDLAVLMRTPLRSASLEAASDSADGHATLIATFYEAANALLAGEPATLLATVISPNLETHEGVAPIRSGERGLRGHLEALRQRGTGALTVVRLIESGQEVAVVVEAYEASSGADAVQEPVAPRWRTVDLFRIASGMIVGYWPGAVDLAASGSLPTVAIPASAELMAVSLARLELGPGSEPTPLTAPVPHLLIVETGTLAISRDHPFEIARAGAARFVAMAADPQAEALVASPGDALFLPQVHPYRVRNIGASSASALSLLVAPSALVFPQERPGSSTEMTVEMMHDGWRPGRRTIWDNNVVTEPLAVKHLPMNRGLADITLRGNQVSLEPGQRNPPLTPGKLRLAIVRAGVVGVSVINSDVVAISVDNPDSALAKAANHLFRAGDAFLIEASEAPVLANAGGIPVDILLIEVAPEGN